MKLESLRYNADIIQFEDEGKEVSQELLTLEAAIIVEIAGCPENYSGKRPTSHAPRSQVTRRNKS